MTHDAGNEPAEPFLKIELEGPPRGKGRPRSRITKAKDPSGEIGRMSVDEALRKGLLFVQVYTDGETRAYEEHLGWLAKSAMRGRAMLRCPIKCEILAMFAIPKSWPKRDQAAALRGDIRPTGKPDWDNIAKVTDALNEIVWKDDSQIVDGRVQKFYGERSFLHIEVYR